MPAEEHSTLPRCQFSPILSTDLMNPNKKELIKLFHGHWQIDYKVYIERQTTIEINQHNIKGQGQHWQTVRV